MLRHCLPAAVALSGIAQVASRPARVRCKVLVEVEAIAAQSGVHPAFLAVARTLTETVVRLLKATVQRWVVWRHSLFYK